MSDEARSLRVAAIQMPSDNGDIAGNLAHALPLVEQAAERGAKLIALPEFLPTGYVFSKAIWDAAEPNSGPTVQWLKRHAQRLGVHLCTTFLEAEGEDFFNTFVLTTPTGDEAGRVRKQTPAIYEAFFTLGDSGSHVVDTELGRIGVGICYENTLAYTGRLMHAHSVDIMLMPHSAPTPMGPLYPGWARRIYNRNLQRLPEHYAKLLGVPAVMINKCGPWNSPLPGLPLMHQRSRFPGFTGIADSDGRLLQQLGAEEGIVIEDVVLDPARKTGRPPDCSGRWAFRLPKAANVFQVIETIGHAWYRLSRDRKTAARRISSAS